MIKLNSTLLQILELLQSISANIMSMSNNVNNLTNRVTTLEAAVDQLQADVECLKCATGQCNPPIECQEASQPRFPQPTLR